MYARSRLTSRQSKRFVERRKARKWVLAGLSAVIAVLAVWGVSRLSRLPSLAISSVSVFGADPDLQGQIQTAALGALKGDYLGLFPKDDTVIYPRSAVASAVKAASPRIDSVSVQRIGTQSLSVTVTEKSPAAVVCASLPDFSGTAESDCYFADADGIIYGTAPAFSGDAYDTYFEPGLNEPSGPGSAVGMRATSTPEFTALQSLFQTLKDAGFDIAGVLMKDGGQYEIYVRNGGASASADTGGSGLTVIYMDDDSPFSDQASNLISFWDKMKGDAAANGKPLQLEYVDVRYGANVFYRQGAAQ